MEKELKKVKNKILKEIFFLRLYLNEIKYKTEYYHILNNKKFIKYN